MPTPIGPAHGWGWMMKTVGRCQLGMNEPLDEPLDERPPMEAGSQSMGDQFVHSPASQMTVDSRTSYPADLVIPDLLSTRASFAPI